MKYWIIARKEILDTTRDKRTLLMMIVMPLLLVPTLIGTLMKIESSQREKASEQKIKIHFIGEEFASDLYRSFEEMEKIVIVDDIPEDSLGVYLQNELLDAAVTIQNDHQSRIDKNGQAKIEIQFKGTDSFNTTREVIKLLLKSSEDQIIEKRMARLNIKQDVVQAYKVEYVDVASKQEVIGSLIGGWLPYIFILFGFMGAMYPPINPKRMKI